MPEINLITISFAPPHPIAGSGNQMVRMTGNDMQKITVAAEAMGLSKSAFMRILLIKGAERVMEELGVKIEYVQNEHVDLSKGETLIE
jgi:hypothetical protein